MSHFDGVDYQGNVMLVEQLGEVDAGKGLKLPLWAVFGSNSGNNSPYVGHGWTIPLLEAKIVQVDENVFKIDQPNGWFRIMWRSKGNPNVLEGQGGWKAEIRGDAITAWADCGSKLFFNKGRLVSMQLMERKIDFVYEGSCVTEIREGGSTILRVEKDALSGVVTGFRLAGNQRVGVDRAQRPMVQVIKGQSLIAGMEPSLSKITQTDGGVRTINYGVDGHINPTLMVGDRLIAWNAASKNAMRDGEWSYEVTPGNGAFDHAAIGRKNPRNQSEFWHLDNLSGFEVVRELNGVERRTTWFRSGILNGKPREYEERRNNVLITKTKYIYDGNGLLIREVSGDVVKNFRNGAIESIEIKGNAVLRFSYKDGFVNVDL